MPAQAPPVRYKGVTYVRVGPTTREATREEERRLTEKQVHATRTFDNRPCPGTSLDDLLLSQFRSEYLPNVVTPDTVAENNREPEDQLASLRLFDTRAGSPTFAAILAFGRNPATVLPGAYVQFARYEGPSLADPVQDSKEIGGNLVTQLSQLDNLLPVQIRTSEVGTAGLRRERRPDYPLVALRELGLNAIMHRNYENTSAPVRINWFSDRVEIQNPGGLYGHVTSENYERVSDYRNPVIAEIMKALGYVEKFGTGIYRANAALIDNGNGRAEHQFETTYTLVTIRSPR